jgi:hypothetical protein
MLAEILAETRTRLERLVSAGKAMPPHPETPPRPPTTTPSSSLLSELRVAQQELHSGQQSGRVFLQLSPGSVAFPLDRSVAQARVERRLQELETTTAGTTAATPTTKEQQQ